LPYQVVFPGDLDEYDWAEIEAKGWLDGVRIVRNGDEFTLAIYDQVRLPQAITVDVERLGYFAASRLLVVPRLSRDDIEIAIGRMAERGFLDLLHETH